MKKGTVIEGIVEKTDFPNKGRVRTEEGMVLVKNVLPGQRVEIMITKSRNSRYEGRLLNIIEPSFIESREADCPVFGLCGGCSYIKVPYEEQLSIKERQVRELIKDVYGDEEKYYEGIEGSPVEWNYRNKMEYSFGDEYKGGPLSLGMHKRGSFYDVLTVDNCLLVHSDYNIILRYTLDFFKEKGAGFYHKMGRQGLLRHLLVRRVLGRGIDGAKILVALVTTSEGVSNMREDRERGFSDEICGGGDKRSGGLVSSSAEELVNEWKEGLLSLSLEGEVTGVLHIINDSLADVVKCESMNVLYGKDYLEESLLGLRFKISVFSFFQTNTLGAEVLYSVVREYVSGKFKNKFLNPADARRNSSHSANNADVIFDLYCGTGTISQILAPTANRVIGVELVEEAVLAARENAERNGLSNCEFIAGDVLKVLDEIEVKPDMIVLDPPRDGINPKALKKIIAYQVEKIVYVSCKPTSLQRDLTVFKESGYELERYRIVDQFPGTGHVESIVLLSRKTPDVIST